MKYIYPIRLEASLHETIWGGRLLERDGWKKLPDDDVQIGESWETEISTIVQNGPYQGQTLKTLVDELGGDLLGTHAMKIFGPRFPLLAKFLDANAKLSVQVHPDDSYAARHENGKLGKTEFWYILAAEPGASIVHGFKTTPSPTEVFQSIEHLTLEDLIHEETVQAGDVVFVPAGTVHAIGAGIMLYELQEYSDVTYRMYDYGRPGADGKPRQLHIERSLDVTDYRVSPRVKANPLKLAGGSGYDERCLVACKYFVTHELTLTAKQDQPATINAHTDGSCVILSSLGAEIEVRYGSDFQESEKLSRGQTMVLPASLGRYRIIGTGSLLSSYVPEAKAPILRQWEAANFA